MEVERRYACENGVTVHPLEGSSSCGSRKIVFLGTKSVHHNEK